MGMRRDLAIAIVKWALVGAICAGLVFAIVWGYERWRDAKVAEGDARGAARVQTLWDADKVRAAAHAVEASRQAAAETLRRINKQQENERAKDQLLAVARRDNARPAVACVRKAAAAIGDALGQCGEIARQAAADADDARVRGLTCEANYDSLTLKLTP
jgi:hypothetical protein